MATIEQDNEEAKGIIFTLKNNRMTYTEIGEKLGYSDHGMISRIMNGRSNVTIDTLNGLRKLAEEYCK